MCHVSMSASFTNWTSANHSSHAMKVTCNHDNNLDLTEL